MDRQSRELTRSQQGSAITPRDYLSLGPFSLMRRMSEEMDRVFGEFGVGSNAAEGAVWSPALEIFERDGKYMVHANLPGMKPENIKVEVTSDALIIEGERKSESKDNKGGVRRTERLYGRFYRAIPLPEGVDTSQIKAKFDNGVLEIGIPAPQQQQISSRQIPVESGSSASSATAESSKVTH
jgi:HSP20 family protein